MPGGVIGGVVGGLPDQKALPAAPSSEGEPKLQETIEVQAEAPPVQSSAAEVVKRGAYSYNVALEQDPKAVLQTGPGVPGWSWRSYSLTWSGPVGRDHTMRLLLASPGVNRVLTLLRLAALAAFAYVLFILHHLYYGERIPLWQKRHFY